jgi:Cytochrome c554 and c-prime
MCRRVGIQRVGVVGVSLAHLVWFRGIAVFALYLGSLPLFAQYPTEYHVAAPGFWPTKSAAPGDEYVGSQVCSSCHAGKFRSQKTTAMAETFTRASDSFILKQYAQLSFVSGKIHYEITSDEKQNTLTVTDGKETISTPLLYAFGNGRVGQSYLFKKRDDNHFYEARVSYFDSLKNLNFTPSRALANPNDLNEAMARQVPPQEVLKCFGCHTTDSTVGTHLQEEKLIAGVSCEACHGPGAEHAAAASAANLAGTPEAARGTIFNAAKLSPADSVDFCGACHITFWDMKLTGVKGVGTSKAQPYRLEMSKCWGKGDARLTCIACHDPHQPLQTDLSSYDRNCLQCHVVSGANKTAEQTGNACAVATKNCVSCHMPKVNAPVMHYAFTDHRIRVVKKDENYPE